MCCQYHKGINPGNVLIARSWGSPVINGKITTYKNVINLEKEI